MKDYLLAAVAMEILMVAICGLVLGAASGRVIAAVVGWLQ